MREEEFQKHKKLEEGLEKCETLRETHLKDNFCKDLPRFPSQVFYGSST